MITQPALCLAVGRGNILPPLQQQKPRRRAIDDDIYVHASSRVQPTSLHMNLRFP